MAARGPCIMCSQKEGVAGLSHSMGMLSWASFLGRWSTSAAEFCGELSHGRWDSTFTSFAA